MQLTGLFRSSCYLLLLFMSDIRTSKPWRGVSYYYLIPVTDTYKSRSIILPQQLVGYWRLRLFNASSPKSVGGLIYNYWQIDAENGGKAPLASNQVVGGSDPSGCAIISMTYSALKICKFLRNAKVPTEFRFSRW